jgi:hypothetical protein
MEKFIAEMTMYHTDREGSTKLAEKEVKITETAPSFFAKIVGEKLIENRHAEDFSQLKPPTKIKLHFSISQETGGTIVTVDPAGLTRSEVEEEVLSRLETFIDLLSGRGTSDSKNI